VKINAQMEEIYFIEEETNMYVWTSFSKADNSDELTQDRLFIAIFDLRFTIPEILLVNVQ
jgi:hypothetical protein